jgi:class 3 adenylate cyclase
VFTEGEGSTELWADEPAVMARALESHDEIVLAALRSHGGYAFASGGDGFGAAFARA